MADTRPPAPPNGCQKYHGIPGCRCQARASKDQQHHGAHHCNEHDRYWTDREEMYVEMYVEIAAKWAALLEHADLAEDVQPEEVIDALSVRCNRRAEDHERAATPAPLDDPVIAAMRPARRGGYRRLTFDNGRYETYDCVFIQHPGGEWDRILIARDDGTIATALAALINATPAPLDVSRLARVMREMCDCIRSDSDAEAWARDIAAAYQADEP